MRRGLARLAAVASVLFLVTFTAGAPSSAATVSAWTALDAATVNQDNMIPAGFPTYSQAKDCAWKDSCPRLADIAYADVDISDAMAEYENGASFELTNGLANPGTVWFVCSYDGTGAIVNCWEDNGGMWGMAGELSQDARELRLLPAQSAANEYHLRVYVW